MSHTHDDAMRTQVPRSRMIGAGHASTWRCAACLRLIGSMAGRKLQRISGIKAWLCKGCAK